MTQEAYKCIKCGFEANRGFLADYSEGANVIAYWVVGEPLQVNFLGIRGTNIEVGGRRQFNVRSLRCERCGFLELYAV